MSACATCRHAIPVSARQPIAEDYRHCRLQPYGLPVAAWLGTSCAFDPPRHEPAEVSA